MSQHSTPTSELNKEGQEYRAEYLPLNAPIRAGQQVWVQPNSGSEPWSAVVTSIQPDGGSVKLQSSNSSGGFTQYVDIDALRRIADVDTALEIESPEDAEIRRYLKPVTNGALADRLRKLADDARRFSAAERRALMREAAGRLAL